MPSPCTGPSASTTFGSTRQPDPFYTFNAPDADVIIRAPLQPGLKEVKYFHAHKTILSVASTVFRDMFSVPQPPQPSESDTALPVVQIAESARVFETFLRLIYPIEPPVINSLLLVDNLFRLVDKYMASGVHARLRGILMSPLFLEKEPILVYSIACRTNLDKEASLTIPYTFNIDLVRDIPHNKLRAMTVGAYHRLLLEHSLRRGELVDTVDEVYRLQGRFPEGCNCAGQLKKEMYLKISRKPFLDEEMLEECLSFAWEVFHSCRRMCPLATEKRGFLFDLMSRIREI